MGDIENILVVWEGLGLMYSPAASSWPDLSGSFNDAALTTQQAEEVVRIRSIISIFM